MSSVDSKNEESKAEVDNSIPGSDKSAKEPTSDLTPSVAPVSHQFGAFTTNDEIYPAEFDGDTMASQLPSKGNSSILNLSLPFIIKRTPITYVTIL